MRKRIYHEHTHLVWVSRYRLFQIKWYSRSSSRLCSRVDFHGGRQKTKFTSLPSFRSRITARAHTLASKGGLKSIRGWPVRWNHRVWETDRATRLDRMGSLAKWMREHYHASLPCKAWSAARTCPSKLHFLFSYRRAPRNILGPDRFFWGKIHRKSNHALSERTGGSAYLLLAHYAKIPSTNALTPKCRSISSPLKI